MSVCIATCPRPFGDFEPVEEFPSTPSELLEENAALKTTCTKLLEENARLKWLADNMIRPRPPVSAQT